MRKIYVNNRDWADEGDVFFFSLSSEKELQSMKAILEALIKYGVHSGEIEMYWGTNEAFEFSLEELIKFIDAAEDISDKELEVFNKFGVCGFDIYDKIMEILPDLLYDNKFYGTFDDAVTPETIEALKPLYLALYSEEELKEIEEYFKKYWKE